VQSLLQASVGDAAVAWPREGTLALDLGHATLAGVDASDIAVKLRHETGILDIDRLVIGDVGGAKLSANGRIDAHDQVPRGALALDLDARSLDGVAALLDKLSPALADRIRRAAPRSVPAKLHASLTLDRSGAGGTSAAKLKLLGNAGLFRLDLQGDASGGSFTSTDLAKLGGTTLHLSGLLDANDGGALVDLLGLDHAVAVNQRSGRITIELSGPLDGDLNLKSQILAGGLDVAANGTVHPLGSRGPTAQLMLRASAADVLPLRSAVARRGTQPPWSTLTARLAMAEDTVSLTDINGTLAGAAVKGDLRVGVREPHKVSGNLTIAALDLPSVLGAALGFPHANAGGDAVWPAEPFDAGLLGTVTGQVTIKAAQVALTPKLSARDLHVVVDLDRAQIAVADLDGALAGGRVGGNFAFVRGDDGVTMHSHLRLTDVDTAELLGGGARPPVSGKLTAELELAGGGRSPIALVGSLQGSGKFSLRNGSLARLDPAAFDVVSRAVDQGLPIDTTRIGDRMDAALAVGGLSIPLAEGTIAAAMGQLRLVDPVVQAKGAAFSLGGAVDLTQQSLDAHLVLSVSKATESAGENRPDISIDLKGAIDAPKRSLNVAALTRWLALRMVDEKAKRVDALEQAAREHPLDGNEGAVAPEREPITTAVPANPPPPAPLPRFVRPNPAASPPTAATGGQDTGNSGAKSDEPRPRRSASGADAPSAPTDIRPSVQRAPRADSAAKPQPARPTNSFLGPLAPLFGQ
jgi:large subunit ribosomal protein L24